MMNSLRNHSLSYLGCVSKDCRVCTKYIRWRFIHALQEPILVEKILSSLTAFARLRVRLHSGLSEMLELES